MAVIESRNEKGELTSIHTEPERVDIPPAQLRYISPCADPMFPADLCIKEGNEYIRFSVNRNQLINIIDTATSLLREFDKRTPEDTYNG